MMMSRKREHSSDGELHLGNNKSMTQNEHVRGSMSTDEIIHINFPTEGTSAGAPQLSYGQEQLIGELVGSVNPPTDTGQMPTSTNYPIKPKFPCKFCRKDYQREFNLKKHLLARQGFPDSVTCEQVKAKHRADSANRIVLLENKIEQLENGLTEKDNELKKAEADLLKFQNLYFLDENGKPKLHNAIEQNDEKFILELIGNGADVNIQNVNLETPLHKIKVGTTKDLSAHKSTIDTLLRNGANAFAKDKIGNTFLHGMVANLTPTQFRQMVACLLENNLAKLFDAPDGGDGATPLQLAVRKMEVTTGTLEALHKSGVNFNAVDTKHGQSVLVYAVQGKGSSTLLSNLIIFGANPKPVNREKQNMLHIAAKRYHDDAIKLFLERGLDINAVDQNGDTPLHLVMQCKMDKLLKTIKLLISKGANPNIRNKDMRTPVYLAALNVPAGLIVDVMTLLFESRKTVTRIASAQDQDDHTLLDYLLMRKPKLTPAQFVEVAEYLVGEGLRKLFYIRNKVCGLTPLEVAMKNLGVEGKILACLEGILAVHVNSEYEYSDVSDDDF